MKCVYAGNIVTLPRKAVPSGKSVVTRKTIENVQRKRNSVKIIIYKENDLEVKLEEGKTPSMFQMG